MLSGPEEAGLARAAATGDGQAFAALYDRYERRIFTYCQRLLGSEDEAGDAMQDAFLNVLRRLPDLDPAAELDFGAYLFTAARNASYEMIRKRKRADLIDEIPAAAAPVVGDEVPALDTAPVESAMLAEQRRSIRAANGRLPERQREVLVLREVEEMSYDEIATVMEMNSNSVAQLISRARVRLREEMRGEVAGAFAARSPECERAFPLLSMRLDRNLDDPTDSEWLDEHLDECETCTLAAEAMAEAGHSYRAWAPILPAAYLFRTTMAKACEYNGADWSGVERPQSGAGSGGGGAGDDDGAGGAGDGAGAEGDGESGAGGASGAGAGGAAAGVGGSGGRVGARVWAGIGAGVAIVALALFMVFAPAATNDPLEGDTAVADASEAPRDEPAGDTADRAAETSAAALAARRLGRRSALIALSAAARDGSRTVTAGPDDPGSPAAPMFQGDDQVTSGAPPTGSEPASNGSGRREPTTRRPRPRPPSGTDRPGPAPTPAPPPAEQPPAEQPPPPAPDPTPPTNDQPPATDPPPRDNRPPTGPEVDSPNNPGQGGSNPNG